MRATVYIVASLSALVGATALADAPASAPTSGAIAAVVTGVGVLDKVQAFYQSTTDYKAAFKQVVRTRSPKRTFHRSGTVFFKIPGMMRWDYKAPDEVYYVSDGEVLWSYDVEEAIAYRMRVKDSDLFHALKFLTGAGNLTRDFDAKVLPTTPEGLTPILLTPRHDDRNFQSVTLFVDASTGETRESEVVDPMGNVSRIQFDRPVFKPLPKEGFSFAVPRGGARPGTRAEIACAHTPPDCPPSMP